MFVHRWIDSAIRILFSTFINSPQAWTFDASRLSLKVQDRGRQSVESRGDEINKGNVYIDEINSIVLNYDIILYDKLNVLFSSITSSV